PVAPAKKSNVGMIYGIAAAIAVIAGGAFMFSGGKKKPVSPVAEGRAAEGRAAGPPAAAVPPQTALAGASALPKPAAPPPSKPTPKPAESKPAPAPAAVAAGKEQWVDGLAQWFGGTKTNEDFVRENNGGARIGSASAILSPIPRSARAFRDQVARVRWHPSDANSSLEVQLRRALPTKAAASDEGFAYHAKLHQKESWTVRLACRVAGKSYYGLQDPKLPADFKFDATHTLEFRVVGDMLSVSVDGKKVGEHRDSQITGGYPAITAKNVIIESFEYANLDPGGSAPALAAVKPGDMRTFAGHRYQFHAGPFIKDEARDLAASLGGHLVTITSAAEQAWIEATFAELIGGPKKTGLCRTAAG
ncbi:MAG: hypothetical protein Q8M07_02725, partial [Prosthecobacter sp.]|nr:hypothetical protein [Prosthecobacter sp.]